MARFEQFKRSKFPRAAMRKLMSDIVGTSNDRCAIVLVRRAHAPPCATGLHTDCASSCRQASLAKTLVGELVETAKEEMTANGQGGPIQPYHLRSAYRRAQQSGSVPSSGVGGRPRIFSRLDCGP